MIRVIHGGQTGVDRGAHEGALDNGWWVGGYMPKNGCDERGPIPRTVFERLHRCTISGYAARTEVNLDNTDTLLVVVPDKDDPYATPGTRLTLLEARRKSLPRLVVQPDDPLAPLLTFIRLQRQRCGRPDIRMMIGGPRESRWSSGRVETAALLRRLKIALDEEAAAIAELVARRTAP